MNNHRFTRPAALVSLLLGLTLSPVVAFAEDNHPKVTNADVEKWMTELSNWGRWGKDDQLGAINLITEAKRKEAAALVKEGISISMAHDCETTSAEDDPKPFSREILNAENNNSSPFYFDRFVTEYHNMVTTHLDALCHMFYHGQMYNGVPRSEVTKSGANKLAVNNVKNGIFTRAVLLDIPRLKGVDFLTPGTPIFPADLDACAEKEGVKIKPGDALLVRTGRWKKRQKDGPWSGSFAGLHASCAPWLHSHDIAIFGNDAAGDVMPNRVEGASMPVHQLVLVAMGAWILDACDFEAVAEQAEKSHRWEFLLTTAPLPVPGATGSPINPIATF